MTIQQRTIPGNNLLVGKLSQIILGFFKLLDCDRDLLAIRSGANSSVDLAKAAPADFFLVHLQLISRDVTGNMTNVVIPQSAGLHQLLKLWQLLGDIIQVSLHETLSSLFRLSQSILHIFGERIRGLDK